MLLQKYKGHFVGDAAPTGPITFRYWLASSTNTTALYLKTIINYFKDFFSADDEFLSENITFTRKALSVNDEPAWEDSSSRIITITPDLHGRIGDQEGHVEMDFANENVGFGTTGTQEELLLGVSPESCPIVLFNETLSPRDVILIQGMKRHSNFKGYGYSAKYTGIPTCKWCWQNRKILAMDAYCHIGGVQVQLESANLKRELNKAYCGFSMVPDAIVDSGHWGCGAFGGIYIIQGEEYLQFKESLEI